MTNIEAFRKSLEQLNDEQFAGATQTEGPTLVLAGPGTGKTHMLAHRVGYLLNTDSGVRPENLLCLTFTNAGVRAMRQRVVSLCGPTAHKVGIYTFHSFADRVIEANPEYFDSDMRSPMDILDRERIARDVLRKNLDKTSWQGSSRNEYTQVIALLNLWGIMMSEGWTYRYMKSCAEQHLKQILTDPKYIYKRKSGDNKAGDVKQALVDAIHKKMDRVLQGASMFKAYTLEKKERGLYDYQDAINDVLGAFEKHEALRLDYAERFQYVMIDEYQDTNGAQAAMVKSFAEVMDNPNVFVVGDEDQSVYSFQGARVKNMIDFADREGSTQLIVMRNNYRSPQIVLDAARYLVEENTGRITEIQGVGIDKHLIAANTYDDTLKISLSEYLAPADEAFAVCDQIETALEEGAKPSDFAIIFRSHRQAPKIAAELERRNIPFMLQREQDALTIPVVRHFVAFLQAINKATDSNLNSLNENAINTLLTFPCGGLSPFELVALRNRYWSAMAKGEISCMWGEAVFNGRISVVDDVALNEKLGSVLKTLKHLLSEVFPRTPEDFVGLTARSCGFVSYATKSPDRMLALLGLQEIQSFAERRATREPTYTLEMLCTDLTDLIKIGEPVRVKTIVGEGVTLTTAHNAKGEEYRHVYIIGALKKQWEAQRKPSLGFSLPPTVTFTSEDEGEESERRLFYVALTRAMESVHVSYTQMDDSGKATEPSAFASTLMVFLQSKGLDVTIDDEPKVPNHLQIEIDVDDRRVEALDLDAYHKTLETLELTVRNITRWTECQVAFYYETVMGLSGPADEHGRFSKALHNAVQRIERQSDANVEASIRYSLLKAVSGLPPADRKSFVDRGMKAIKGWVGTHKTEVEGRLHNQYFKTALSCGLPVKVKVDAYDRLTNTITERKGFKLSSRHMNGSGFVLSEARATAAVIYDHQANTATGGGVVPKVIVEPISSDAAHELSFDPAELIETLNFFDGIGKEITEATEFESCESDDCAWCQLHSLHRTELKFESEATAMIEG